jgi:serine/threonine protein kinase
VLDNGALDVDRSISIGQQVAEARAYAHGLGIVHRDVKPANVIVDADPTRVRLADFGIARLSDSTRITAAGKCIGTAAYLAPEQLEGQAGPAADIYALGLVVLECLTGTRCYHGTPAETTMARLHRSPVVPTDLPSWLRHTLRAMTARDPRCRPLAGAAAKAFGWRSVDPVLASTAEVDASVLSTSDLPGTTVEEVAGTSAWIPRGRTARPSWKARARRRPLLLAFGGGVLTSAAAFALSLMVWPFGARGVQATEPQAPAIPTSTTVDNDG